MKENRKGAENAKFFALFLCAFVSLRFTSALTCVHRSSEIGNWSSEIGHLHIISAAFPPLSPLIRF
jgi:hypothetical protein